MKKIIIALSFLIATLAFAETPKPGDELGPQMDDAKERYEFYWNQIPVVCGQNTEIERWANDKGFEPVNVIEPVCIVIPPPTFTASPYCSDSKNVVPICGASGSCEPISPNELLCLLVEP